jgi:hypothetical protein
MEPPMKKIKTLAVSLLLALSLASAVFADEAFNPDDETGRIVTLVNKNFITTVTQWNPVEIMYINSDTKITFHNGKKVIKAGDVIKYGFNVDEDSNYYFDEIHVYNFDIKLLP